MRRGGGKGEMSEENADADAAVSDDDGVKG